MAKERERKFLVKKRLLPKLDKGRLILQGYLAICKGGTTVRVRQMQTDRAGKPLCHMAVKGPPTGNTRDEFEYRISPEDAMGLMHLCGKNVITKVRHKIDKWEIDEYIGKHDGLIIAEYEFKNGEKNLPSKPKWLGREVSNVWAYSNAFLATCK